jgi:hypothetical protein
VSGSLPLAELAASAGIASKKMAALLADFESAGIVERVGEDWRLARASTAAEYLIALDFIRGGNVPLEEGDDNGMSRCRPGPAPLRAAP